MVAGIAAALALSGCAAVAQLRGEAPPSHAQSSTDSSPSTIDIARSALAGGNLDAADATLSIALAPPDGSKGPNGNAAPAIVQTPDTAELLVLRAELRLRQARYPDAESDALTAMALLPATAPSLGATAPSLGATAPSVNATATRNAARRTPWTQRSVHVHLAQLYEDAGRDDNAEQHLVAAQDLCGADPALDEHGDCNLEREALLRIRMARGRYAEAEPLVLAEIADVQSRFGAYDLRLSVALCHVARFYARQGQYALSGPLFSRSFDLWKTVRDDAFSEHTHTLAAGQPSPFDSDFLRPRAGHAPFAAPCGLEEQAAILYKLGKADVAADAIRFERALWTDDTEAGIAAVAALDALTLRGADPLDLASAHHAIAFVALKKGDMARAEQELRVAVDAYTSAWPTLAISERRYRVEDYLRALESLVELLRSSQRFAEAIPLGERAEQVATATVDPYDAVRLDTLLSEAKTFREMRDPERAESAAGRYLDAVVGARGDTSADYAWALRTISYAYLLRDETDASQRMEMQAKAIWAKQAIVAPAF